MTDERIKDGATWYDKKDGAKVIVVQSARQGFTFCRREISVRKDGATPLREMKTKRFLKLFAETPPATETAPSDTEAATPETPEATV